MGISKVSKRKRIHYRVRKKVKGTAERPRLSIFRSNRYIYVQAINDLNGHTLAAADSREESVGEDGTKSDQAKKVGQLIAERLKAVNVERAVFDRAGYLYHGRVKALAEGAREGGLKL